MLQKKVFVVVIAIECLQKRIDQKKSEKETVVSKLQLFYNKGQTIVSKLQLFYDKGQTVALENFGMFTSKIPNSNFDKMTGLKCTYFWVDFKARAIFTTIHIFM